MGTNRNGGTALTWDGGRADKCTRLESERVHSPGRSNPSRSTPRHVSKQFSLVIPLVVCSSLGVKLPSARAGSSRARLVADSSRDSWSVRDDRVPRSTDCRRDSGTPHHRYLVAFLDDQRYW